MSDTYIFLQHYWWFLVSLLGALLVFLMFVQGGQSLLWQLGKTEAQRRMLLISTGREWELTFTTLVTFGGAFFASFPLFYSTSFGGAYWVWMLILFSFVVQAVSYEFQLKKGNVLGTRTYRSFLWLNGMVGPLLIGTAVATFFSGAEFVVNKTSLTHISMPVISRWANPLHGLEAALVPFNLLLGFAVLFLSRVLACLYFLGNIGEEELRANCRRCLLRQAFFFLVFFLTFMGYWLTMDGFGLNPSSGLVEMQPYKYALNLLSMPAVAAVLVLGVVLVLTGIILPFVTERHHGIWFAGVGTVLTVLALLLCAGWNGTAYYPSLVDLQSSLTISNSCSSEITLAVMSVVSLLIPFVLAYIAWAWRVLDREAVSAADAADAE